MKTRLAIRFVIPAAMLAIGLPHIACGALVVTSPGAGSATIAAGDDYATQVMGDAWDMNNAEDIDADESVNLASQTYAGGYFSATDTSASGTCGASFVPLEAGYGTQTVTITRGPKFPIDTSKYRYFTMKIKQSGGSQAQTDRVIFYQDGDSTINGTYGSSTFGSVTPNQWNFQTWDFFNDVFTTNPYMAWTSLPHVEGLQVFICNSGSPSQQIDWIRLTAAPTSAQKFNVTWTDSVSSTYTITAIDSDSARFTLGSGVSGTSYNADFSRLAPGDYHVEVKRADNTTATSTGVVHINTPPQTNITSPSARGEQSQSYALTAFGYQWGPMAAKDFKLITNFTNVSYTNPVGSFSARPTNGDPQLVMNTTGHTIDASLYRSICFTQEIFGPRSVGLGSVARAFWGVTSANVAITTDIVLGSGLREYCLPDLADTTNVPLVSGPAWAGTLGFLRFDPDEFTPPAGCNTPQTCHDVRLDSIILSPFALAAPSYTLHWTVTDADYASGGSIKIYLDPDKTFGNGNEISIATVPYTTGSYNLTAGATIPDGTYNVVLLVDDGVNAVATYAGGKLITHGGSDEIFRNGFEAN